VTSLLLRALQLTHLDDRAFMQQALKTVVDITERKGSEARIKSVVNYDYDRLTGLPNRVLLTDLLV
jgi:hypothetical protein